MLTPDEKQKFLTELEEIPIVSVVCKRVGIAKATVYRWRKDDPKFSKAMDAALEIGRDAVTDLAEGQTISLMKKGDFRAIKLWLENNTQRYYKPRTPIKSPRPDRVIQTVQIRVVDSKNNLYPIKDVVTEPEEAPEQKPPLVRLKPKIPPN